MNISSKNCRRGFVLLDALHGRSISEQLLESLH